MKKTIKQVQKDLQGLLDEVGADHFPRTKALYLKDVQLMDAEGNEIDPDTVDLSIEIAPASKMEEEEEEKAVNEEEEAEKKAEEEDEEKAEEEDEETKKSFDIDAAVSKAVSKALATKNNVKTKGNDMRFNEDKAGMKRWGSLKHLSSDNVIGGDAELEAYRIGRWAAACMGHRKSADWCQDRGIETKAHLETVNSQGGFLVPEQFSDTLISLREKYGVARRVCKIEPMTSDVKRIPKRSATLSASFVGEATIGSESTQTFEQVNLVAKKLMVLSSISSELNEDALISIGDSLAGEISYAFSRKEDECVFQGDGTSPFGNIIGVVHAVNNVSSNAGIHTCASGDTAVGNMLLSDFNDAMALLPSYADTPNTRWFMHKSVYAAAAEKLAFDKGTTTTTIFDGTSRASFLGYPVEFVQAMPTSTAAAGGSSDLDLRYPVLFGDMSLGTCFGDRRANTISFSDSALNAFEQDEIIVRGTERFDFVAHTPGTSSEAGPVVAIKLAAS